ncbi:MULTISPECIES: polysaccharide deacetylase family protein [unclassified Mesorhizobium]|uniref:polysaccharide deacetylase family protein n=1 Tax=unclassified Mesorhizobium TaxID=325217 RepID=UPI00333D1238
MTVKTARKRVVIHEDDVGMSHGANVAFFELSKFGTCSSGSVMAPCPWFPEAAQIAVANPDFDLGVHLTLTSEQKPYRWRPLTNPPKSAAMTDEFGYFWPTVPQARKAHPDAVEAELRAQIECAIAAGIDITHLDAHMGTAQMPEFIAIYRKLGREYRLPALLVKDLSGYNPASYAGELDIARYDAEIVKAQAAGEPVFDIVLETPWARKTDAQTAYHAMFARIPEGLSFLSLHFNTVGDFEAINPPDAHLRTEEYALFKTARVKAWISEFDIEVIGMRGMRDELRAAKI